MANEEFKWWHLLIGIALLVVGVYSAILLINYFILFLRGLDKEVAAAIIAAVGTVLAAVGATLFAQRRANLREIAEAHRPKKIEIYNRFMDMVSEFQKSPEGLPEKDTIEFFVQFTKDTMVWSSPGFLSAWRNFKTQAQFGGSNSLLLMDDLLRAIRDDLNISNRGIKRGDLVKMFLKDPSELDKAIAEEKGKKVLLND